MSTASVPQVTITAINDFSFLVQYIPAWFPGAYFKRLTEEYKGYFAEVRNAPFNHVKEQMVRALLFVGPYIRDLTSIVVSSGLKLLAHQ